MIVVTLGNDSVSVFCLYNSATHDPRRDHSGRIGVVLLFAAIELMPEYGQ